MHQKSCFMNAPFYLVVSVCFALAMFLASDIAPVKAATVTISPGQSVQDAINQAKAGDTIYLRGGTYRQELNFWPSGTSSNRITLTNYGNEIPVIKGSDVVTGWVNHRGSIWKKIGWDIDSQQVFDNGSPLQQIGQPANYSSSWEYQNPVGGASGNVSSMTAGSFYYDRTNKTLFVWLANNANPNQRTIEASTRRRVLLIGGEYVTIKGITFRHSNNGAYPESKQSAMVELGSHCIIQNCDIQYGDFAGVSMGWEKSNSVVDNCTISNNGSTGVNAPRSYNFTVKNSKLNNNNYRKFNPFWHAGGIKAIPQSYGVVEGNEAANNRGVGIWFDTCDSWNPITVRNNNVHDNYSGDGGIMIEISKAASVYNNLVYRNSNRGIYISGSDDSKVYNNTVVANSGWAAIEVGGMPRTTGGVVYTLKWNKIYNNIIANNTCTQDFYMYRNQGSDIVDNTSNWNVFFRSSGSIVLTAQNYYIDSDGQQQWTGQSYYNLTNFSNATGWDTLSKNANPAFITENGTNYAINRSSPAYNAASSQNTVPFDFTWTSRPIGGGYDIGAYEAR